MNWTGIAFVSVLLGLAAAAQFFSAIQWDVASIVCLLAAAALVVGSVLVCAVLIAVVDSREDGGP